MTLSHHRGGAEPHPAALTDAVEDFLDELGWADAHVAGNSLGGWVALELAKAGRTRSVCALSPAGWWNRRERAWANHSLANGRRSARRLPVERVAGGRKASSTAWSRKATSPS